MKQFFTGIIAGIILGLVPLSMNSAPSWLRSEWSTAAGTAASTSPFILASAGRLAYSDGQQLHFYNADGSLKSAVLPDESIFHTAQSAAKSKDPSAKAICAMSAAGNYYALYGKVSDFIDLYDAAGMRYWQIASTQYPSLSANAKLIALLVADQSVIYFRDINGNATGDRIAGRFCTVIAFSETTDNCAAGFLGGTYFITGADGKIRHAGSTGGIPVKSAAVSDSGAFAAIHYGMLAGDRVRIINVASGDTAEFTTTTTHRSRTGVHIDNDGTVAMIDGRVFSMHDADGDELLRLPIPEQTSGHARIISAGNLRAAAYRIQSGSMVIAADDSRLIFQRALPDSASDITARGNLIFARGTQMIHAWSVAGR